MVSNCLRLFKIILYFLIVLDCFRLKLMEIDVDIGGLEFGFSVTRFPSLFYLKKLHDIYRIFHIRLPDLGWIMLH